nr:ceramidase domain-containing protein [Candidatus Sigynarchaeota archaeon]
MTRSRLFLYGVGFTIASLAAFFILAGLGWPGEIHFCVADNHCYCEIIQWSAIARQPVNTWSNLGCVVVGLVVLWRVDKAPVSDSIIKATSNPLREKSAESALYGFLVIFIGIGSIFFHGGMTNYGGLLDNVAMNAYITFLVLYNFERLGVFSRRNCIILLIPVNIVLGWLSILPHLGRDMFAWVVAVEVVFELVILVAGKFNYTRLRRSWKLFVASLATFGVAMLAWNLSKTGALLCFPDSVWQGHAGWHLIVALSTWFIFKYVQSEFKVETAS